MGDSTDLAWASAVELARLVGSGAVSADEIATDALARVDRLDPGLGAVVIDLRDRAPAQQPRADALFAGVPVLLKDAGEELAGTSTWIGTQALRTSDVRSTTTTAFAARLEELGLRILGRSACPELSAGASTEPVGFAPTRNPWDRSRSAGGSSGGAAAAVAAGLVPFAHGSDATGSLRYPAACCGVVTLKPSRGRVGMTPPAGSPDPAGVWTQFALARHVEDLAALFAVVAAPAPGPHRPPWTRRAGVLRHDPMLGLPVHPATVAAVDAVSALLARRGWTVEEEHPPELRPPGDAFWRGLATFTDHGRAQQVRWIERRIGRRCEHGDGDLTEPVLASAARGATLPAELVAAAADATTVPFRTLAQWWRNRDLLVCPALLDPAWPLGTPADVHCGLFCLPFSFSGQPAMVVPSGVFHEGLPVGVQLVGGVGDDERLLALAADLEHDVDWTRWRPPGCG